jgi:hypothetical protein
MLLIDEAVRIMTHVRQAFDAPGQLVAARDFR